MPAPQLPSPNLPRKSWTAREVRRLIADAPLATPRYELVDGELLVTPSPSVPHQDAAFLLCSALNLFLGDGDIGRAYMSPSDVELEPGVVVQPDVFVMPMHEARRLLTEMPARALLVAAEVVSPSSGRFDRVTKRPVYQRYVPEYWVVDLDARLVERWHSGDERPAILVKELEWQPAGAPEPFRMELPGYFARVFLER